MADDPDAIWKPGYEAESTGRRALPRTPGAAHSESDADSARGSQPGTSSIHPHPLSPAATSQASGATTFEIPISNGPIVRSASRRAPRRTIFVALAALVTVGAVFGLAISSDSADDDSDNTDTDTDTNTNTDTNNWGDIDAVAGVDARRLPSTADQLWSTTIDPPTDDSSPTSSGESGESGRIDSEPTSGTTQFAIDGRSTVVAVLPTGPGTSLGIGLDASTGQERWRTRYEFDAASANLLGSIDQVLIVEQNDTGGRRLIGIDLATGSTIWERATRDNGIHLILAGTNRVTRVSFTGNPRLTFVDPATGAESNRLGGRLIGTDHAGTWYVENDRRISAVDLGAGPIEPVEVAQRIEGWAGPTAVVDGQVIVLTSDGALGRVVGDDGRLEPLEIGVGAELPDIVALVSTGDESVMAIGDGRVVGLDIVDDTVEVVWSRRAAVRSLTATGRGVVVVLSDNAIDATGVEPGDLRTNSIDDADLVIVDATTGEQLVDTGAASEADALPQLLGDGFVITNDAGLGRERVGHDLNGNVVWRLPTNGPIDVGDRILVTVSEQLDGITFTAFGDSDE